MINITFFKEDYILGFEIQGHSGSAESGQDIVCASVSSAAYLVVNTITDIMKIEPDDLSVSDGEMFFKLKEEDATKCKDILDGFELHLTELSKQYSEFIHVIENKE